MTDCKALEDQLHGEVEKATALAVQDALNILGLGFRGLGFRV